MELQISLAEFGAMVRAARKARKWSQENLADEAFSNATRKGYVSQIENGKLPNISALTVQKLALALQIDRAKVDAMLGVVAPEPDEIRAEIAALRSEKGSLDEALSQVRTLNRGQWIALATQFELDKPFDASDGALVEFLTLKATDFRALRAEVDAIDEGIKALSNLKASAMAAFDSGDLDEVEILLSRVQEIAKDEAAKAAEIRADAALLRQRPDFARALLLDAADSFAILDPLEPARRRLAYGLKFVHHGTHYGGDGLRIAAEFWEKSAKIADREDDDILRGKALSNLGGALQTQGSRTAGPEGAAILAHSVSAYRAAMEVRTRDAHPVDWASMQNNLAIALQTQGSRTDGPEGAALLAKAVSAYRAALEVTTREAHPVHWAQTQNNLANALKTQGTRTAGPEGAALLAQAVSAYRAALEVLTREAHPVDWALTQENLALAEEALADHDTITDPAPHLRAALDHVTAALEVFDPTHMPYNFTKATNLKTRLEEKLTTLNTP